MRNRGLGRQSSGFRAERVNPDKAFAPQAGLPLRVPTLTLNGCGLLLQKRSDQKQRAVRQKASGSQASWAYCQGPWACFSLWAMERRHGHQGAMGILAVRLRGVIPNGTAPVLHAPPPVPMVGNEHPATGGLSSPPNGGRGSTASAMVVVHVQADPCVHSGVE